MKTALLFPVEGETLPIALQVIDYKSRKMGAVAGACCR